MVAPAPSPFYMLHKKTETGDGVMILYNSDYTARALTLSDKTIVNYMAAGFVPAGTPVSIDGYEANAADAFGVLFHDVPVDRPQATVVYRGTINMTVATKHMGKNYTAEAISAMKGLTFFGENAAPSEA